MPTSDMRSSLGLRRRRVRLPPALQAVSTAMQSPSKAPWPKDPAKTRITPHRAKMIAIQVRKGIISMRNNRVNKAANNGALLMMTTVLATDVNITEVTKKIPPVQNNTAEVQAILEPEQSKHRSLCLYPRPKAMARETKVNSPLQDMTFQAVVSAKRMSKASKLMAVTPALTMSSPIFRSLVTSL